MIASFLRSKTRTAAECTGRARKRPGTRRFLRDVRGGATSFAAIGVAVMTVGAAALIVDHNWLVDQRDTLKYASDAAAIAATIEMTRPEVQSKSDNELTAHLEQVAKGYALLNLSHLSGERLQKAKDSLKVKVKHDREENTVDVDVSADLGGTLFSRYLLDNSQGPEKVAAVARVKGTSNPIEVVLAIDISTSMLRALDGGRARADGSDSRMAILKRAATSLVDILGPNAKNRVAVGLVPWQAQVRLDSATQKEWADKDEPWAKYPDTRHYDAPYDCKPRGNCSIEDSVDYPKKQDLPDEDVEEWLGCLDEHRVDGADHADLPAMAELMKLPEDSPFAQGIYISRHYYAYDCVKPPPPADFANVQECYGPGTQEGFAIGVLGGVPAQHFCAKDVPTILPLTTDASSVKAAVGNLKAVGINTYSALGLLWGQRLLTHDWKAVWGDSVHPVDPASEESTGARKAIVLLTDGEDNMCGYFDPSCTNSNVAIARETACSIAKKAGIEVFVIAAMHPDKVSGTLGASLQACSSQDDNPNGKYVFLNNSDAATLETAFADIADQLKVFRRVY